MSYQTEAPAPEQWLRFLSELLEPEDIPALQEYLGYCLIPSTKGQKMLMLIGKGGEGKSRIGVVMNAIFGFNMNTTSIQKVENNRFARADLEGKLLMVDDDLDMNALTKTNYAAYKRWCEDNAENPLSPKSFANQLSQNAERYHLEPVSNLHIGGGKRCRGYMGIYVLLSPMEL